MPKFPSQLRVGGVNPAIFQRRSDLYSVLHDKDGQAVQAQTMAVMPDDTKGTFAVYKGRPENGAGAEKTGPVYSVGPDGPLAVPTGRVFVRLAQGVSPADRREHFAKAGFEIERTLSYAPNAAWLHPKDGGVGEALAGIATLETLPDVVHVEPQMLLERVQR
jgi:hypothetical protein